MMGRMLLQQHQEMSTPSTRQHVYWLFFFIGGVVFVAVFAILFILWKCIMLQRRRKILKSSNDIQGSDNFSGNFRTTSYFDYQTLKKATKNFHAQNQLGRGGFGPVYLGTLEDGRKVAVKQLLIGKSGQGESEFLSEVKMITSIQHKNLVRLIGCCSEGSERLLVYEYMKNRSLDKIIFGKEGVFLSWSTRFQIITGIARGLQYLHEDSYLRIVHRDIKASNILLDEKFQPKISDFGLARFFPEDETYLSTTYAGTLGYTAPEYAIRGELSEKADIYSFGVLVLEIISCRMNTDLSLPSEMQYLPEYAWRLYEDSRMIHLVDERLKTDGIVEGDILQVCQVALLCLQPYSNLRPPMSEIVAMLISKNYELKITPVKPAFLGRKDGVNPVFCLESFTEFNSSSPLPCDSASFTKHHNSFA